ncbi:hypothetical protein D3C72_1188390 [compost metagenome]
MDSGIVLRFYITGIGWMRMVVEVGRRRVDFEFSDVRDGLPQIIDALIALCRDKKCEVIEFELEPDELVLRLEWLCGNISIIIGDSVLIFDDWRQKNPRIQLEYTNNSDSIVHAFYQATIDLIEKHGLDGVNNKWDTSKISKEQLGILRNMVESRLC